MTTNITIAAIECGGTSFRIAICTISQPPPLQKCTTDDDNNNNNTTTNNNNNINNNIKKEDIQFLYRKQLYTNIGIKQLRHEIHGILQSYSNIIQAVGIASFGPIQLQHTNNTNTNTNNNENNNDDEYGMILSTSPKVEFHSFNIVTIVQEALSSSKSTKCQKNIPIVVDTDVNAPAMAEYIQYNHHDSKNHNQNTNNNKLISSLAYITVGTGVGVGLIINHLPVHGLLHPELGHVPILPYNHLLLYHQQQNQNDHNRNTTTSPSPPISSSSNNNVNEFSGYSWGRRDNSNIPFHGRYTVEGMTSSVALTERYYHYHNSSTTMMNDTNTTTTVNNNNNNEYDRNVLATLDDQHEVWDHVAYHIASLCTTLFLFSIERIVLGGGVIMGRQHTNLLHKIHTMVQEQLNGYLLPLQTLQAIQSRIVVSEYFGNDSGLYGAIYLAQKAYNDHHQSIQPPPDEPTTTDSKGLDDKEESTMTHQQKSIKQTAFHHGLWHGILIGMIGTGLFYKYCCTSQGRRAIR